MRILFVCKSLPDTFKGGISTHVWELTRELVARGHEVSILTGGSWRTGPQRSVREGRVIYHLPYLPGRRALVLRKTLEDLSFNLAATWWLRANGGRFDRIHLQGRSGCFYAGVRARHSTPVITTFHRLLDIEYAYDGQRAGWLDGRCHRAIMRLGERWAARRSDHVVAVSHEMERALREGVPGALAPLSILPNGVRRGFGEPIATAQRWRLAFVGRLERIKGVYPLLHAIHGADRRVELDIIGEGPERAGLEALIARLGLGHRVRLLGGHDAESVRYHIQRAYALILPSFHESQGIVLLEAGVCGRPVLAAAAPGIDEVVVHDRTGLLFPAGDASAMARAIDRLFGDPGAAARLGAGGRARALEVYDWTSIAERTLALYRGVGEGQPGEPTPRRRTSPSGVATGTWARAHS